MSVVMKVQHARALTMFRTFNRISRPRMNDAAGQNRVSELLEAGWINLAEKDYFGLTEHGRIALEQWDAMNPVSTASQPVTLLLVEAQPTKYPRSRIEVAPESAPLEEYPAMTMADVYSLEPELDIDDGLEDVPPVLSDAIRSMRAVSESASKATQGFVVSVKQFAEAVKSASLEPTEPKLTAAQRRRQNLIGLFTNACDPLTSLEIAALLKQGHSTVHAALLPLIEEGIISRFKDDSRAVPTFVYGLPETIDGLAGIDDSNDDLMLKDDVGQPLEIDSEDAKNASQERLKELEDALDDHLRVIDQQAALLKLKDTRAAQLEQDLDDALTKIQQMCAPRGPITFEPKTDPRFADEVAALQDVLDAIAGLPAKAVNRVLRHATEIANEQVSP